MQRNRVPNCATGNREDSLGEFGAGSGNGEGAVGEGMQTVRHI